MISTNRVVTPHCPCPDFAAAETRMSCVGRPLLALASISISIGESKQKEKEVLIYVNKTRISGTVKWLKTAAV